MIGKAILGPHRLSLPQIALIATVGLLVIVVSGLMLRAYFSTTRAATAFEEAGYATTTLANIQREVLLLRIETHALFSNFTEGFEPIESAGRDFEPVELRRDFLTAQLRVASQGAGQDETLARLDQISSTLAEYDRVVDLVRADPTFDRSAAIAQSDEILIQLERQVKTLYDRQEVQFFRATAASLNAQGSAQTLLLVVGGIMLTLSLVLAASLRQSVRTGFKRAYGALELEINERMQAQEAERVWADETSIMAEIGRVISSSLDINQVYESLGGEIHKLIPFDRMSLNMVDYESGTRLTTWALGDTVPGRREGDHLPLAGSLAGEVVRTKLPIMLEAETEADLDDRFPLLLSSFRAGFRMFLTVPLFSRDAVIGVLRVQSKERGIYSKRDLELLERIGNQIAGAIASSQIYAQLKQAQETVRTSEELFRQIADNIPEVVFLVDHENYEILYINPAVEEIWGRPPERFYQQPTAWIDAIHPDDVERVKAAFQRQQSTGEFREEFRVIRPDGSIRWIDDSVVPIRDELGQIFRLVGIAEDVTERREAEDKIKASLTEKEVLLKEINHRVKNNLQIISSLLNLQSRDIQDEEALRSFQVSQDRIKAMALVHEKLYQSEDLARIDFGEYIRSLATDLGSSYGLASRDINLKIDVENILLVVDTAIPCGVIVNELVANSLKHAFPGDRSGEIAISFREADGQYTMVFKDNGVGLPQDLDISHPSSLGLTIVNALAGQLGGTISLGRNGGSEISVTFPATQSKGD